MSELFVSRAEHLVDFVQPCHEPTEFPWTEIVNRQVFREAEIKLFGDPRIKLSQRHRTRSQRRERSPVFTRRTSRASIADNPANSTGRVTAVNGSL